MAGPSRGMPARNSADDEADFGYGFQSLAIEDTPYPTYMPLQSPYIAHARPPYQPAYNYEATYPLHTPQPGQPSHHPFIPFQPWTAPMSPIMPTPYSAGHTGRTRHGSFVGDTSAPWTPPSSFMFTPQQPSAEFSPVIAQPPYPRSRQNRMSWSGPPSNRQDRERKAYHPQPPARRSDWVMWVGNVPPNTSHEELWRYFNNTAPPGDESWPGPSSIFLISRSSCAFVNLSSEKDLDRAINFFNGRPLRQWDPRCPRMVCRVRRKDDDLRAGVGAQRGTGMHREWVKQSDPPLSPAVLEPPPDGEGRRRDSVVEESRHRSSNSLASTNSSFLLRHFPKRVFILKSAHLSELEESVRTGMWRTQKHNEPILDQAFRTAPEVFLIFGANKTGEFFGYAKMVEPIDKAKAAARAQKHGSSGSSKKEPTINEERPQLLSPQSSASIVPTASPGQLTPAEELEPDFDARSATDPPKAKDGSVGSFASLPADMRSRTLDPAMLKAQIPAPIAAIRAAEGKFTEPGTSNRPQENDNGVWRKDTLPTPIHEEAPLDESYGFEFKIEWIRVASIPFHRTRHLRNPWNADREVKVSRDGTEVEPNVGSLLMMEWDNIASFQ